MKKRRPVPTETHKRKCSAVYKVCYSHKKHAANQVAIGRQKGLDLEYYKCPHCGDYHLTKRKDIQL